jgi:hypothetical protein
VTEPQHEELEKRPVGGIWIANQDGRHVATLVSGRGNGG